MSSSPYVRMVPHVVVLFGICQIRTDQDDKRGDITCVGGRVDPALDGDVATKCAVFLVL